MSVLDLDFYKLTMLQFIWRHYADVPVTFRLHSRKQDLADIVKPFYLQKAIERYRRPIMTPAERSYLSGLGYFEEAFLDDLERLFKYGMPEPIIEDSPDGVTDVSVTGDWFKVSLWETVILSAVSEQYSVQNVRRPNNFVRYADIHAINESGAKWADFGTRRRWAGFDHAELLAALVRSAAAGEDMGFIGTSNVHFAHQLGLKPIGTYAHELEMVLRTLHKSEFDTTRDVLTKWQELYPRELRIALTDTYTTPHFLENHGQFLLDNDWRGVRLDSGNPKDKGIEVAQWLWKNVSPGESWDVVFSDGLDAQTIVDLQSYFEYDYKVNPVFGWGTGLTNPNSDLSLVMKAVEANGQQTYKVTDDKSKAIR